MTGERKSWKGKLDGLHPAIRIGVRLSFDGDCWVLEGHRDARGGHRRVYYEGRIQKAHRVVWQMWYGPIPEGMCVLHRCDNPPCVNPIHLFLGTVADNNADCQAKGRRYSFGKGVASPRARLNAEQVRAIREAYPAFSGRQLASRFGVSLSVIQRVVARQSYKDVPDRGDALQHELDRADAHVERERHKAGL